MASGGSFFMSPVSCTVFNGFRASSGCCRNHLPSLRSHRSVLPKGQNNYDFIYVFALVCTRARAHFPQHTGGGQRPTFRTGFSPPPWVLGLNSGSQAWQRVPLPAEPCGRAVCGPQRRPRISCILYSALTSGFEEQTILHRKASEPLQEMAVSAPPTKEVEDA